MNLQIIFPLINPNQNTVRTLDSIINQSYKNYNIDIFINDYSEKDDEFIKSNEVFKNKKIRIFKQFLVFHYLFIQILICDLNCRNYNKC